MFIHGFVASAAAFVQQYDLMLVPLLSGGGMRVKIIEGMALGKCILSTSLGAEGVAAPQRRKYGAARRGRRLAGRPCATTTTAACRWPPSAGLPPPPPPTSMITAASRRASRTSTRN